MRSGTAREPVDPVDVQWSRVSEKLITLRVVGALIGFVIALLVFSVPVVLMLSDVWPGFPAWLAWALPAVVVVVSVWSLLLIPRQVRAIGYAERHEDLLIRQGLFFQRVMVVPYGRMQYVDISVGPIERALGLASLKLHTASPSTNATLVGLPSAEAARLREQLSSLGEAKLAGL
ncbi:PH domain-containing protein [Arthrobacter castelli]|uniref:PH domain-containing protein n=1 Tax=Arthrobacter castelli TaxID=271431 RepID=UPI0004250155|nr:PH domain-containing protein [Arthrobacter castelli]